MENTKKMSYLTALNDKSLAKLLKLDISQLFGMNNLQS